MFRESFLYRPYAKMADILIFFCELSINPTSLVQGKVTFDVRSNSPFASQANTMKFRRRISLFIRSHLGLFLRAPLQISF